ncbi:hypothetical protein B0H11DRAFT_1928671 [Mycena galericulata]|nr:hypothetical protein B0H11DRAFT_1928671 [Mycena galericulata]
MWLPSVWNVVGASFNPVSAVTLNYQCTISRMLKSVPVREVPKTLNRGHPGDPKGGEGLEGEKNAWGSSMWCQKFMQAASKFLFAIDAAGLSDHFKDALTGTAQAPVAPPVGDPNNPTADETRTTNEYLTRRRIWKSEQVVIKQGIAKEMWTKVKGEYEK